MLYREMNELHILQYWLQSGCDDEQGAREVDASERKYPKNKNGSHMEHDCMYLVFGRIARRDYLRIRGRHFCNLIHWFA